MEMNDLPGGSVTLWQFLLELLVGNQHPEIIQWTSHEGEFMLLQAEEVAHLWGMRKNKNHRMNYDKLSRALRYYYQKNIIKKVHGHKFVYRFVYLPEEGLASYRKALGSAGEAARRKAEAAMAAALPQPPISIDAQKSPSAASASPRNVESPGPICLDGRDLATPPSSPTVATTTARLEIKVEPRSACCNCRCHDSSSPPPTSLSEDSPPAKQARLTPTGLPSSHPSNPLTPESAMHHKRHTINMQRLAQQLRLQTQKSTDPSTNGHCSPPVPPLPSPSRRRAAPSLPLPPSPPPPCPTEAAPQAPPPFPPFLDFSQARLYPPSGFPPPSTAGQQCVWMPIPVTMLSRWWQSLANLGVPPSPSGVPVPLNNTVNESASHNKYEES